MTRIAPTNTAEIVDAIAWAAAEVAPLEIVGRGSKRGIGHPAQAEHCIDLSALTGLTLYEPAELVLSAQAGTPLAEIEQLLALSNQQLAFEPMDYGPLLGGAANQSTIAGVLMANLAGPRRLKAGAARDHVLGINAVSGRGEAFKSGGRVVKNVTGYDMSKLLAGSWGTLAVVTDVTFKVLPAAETETTLALRGLLEDQAAAAMALALGSSCEVSSAAHLPEGITSRVVDGALGSDAATLLRLEGFGPSVASRLRHLKSLLAQAGYLQAIDAKQSRVLWRDIRDCKPFADGTDRPVWRISAAPADAHNFVLALRQQVPAEAFYDWQGGLVWLRMFEDDPAADVLRALLERHGGGHATLVRASAAIRQVTPVFQPQPSALAALSQRLKQQFDPAGILNPGRMAGI